VIEAGILIVPPPGREISLNIGGAAATGDAATGDAAIGAAATGDAATGDAATGAAAIGVGAASEATSVRTEDGTRLSIPEGFETAGGGGTNAGWVRACCAIATVDAGILIVPPPGREISLKTGEAAATGAAATGAAATGAAAAGAAATGAAATGAAATGAAATGAAATGAAAAGAAATEVIAGMFIVPPPGRFIVEKEVCGGEG